MAELEELSGVVIPFGKYKSLPLKSSLKNWNILRYLEGIAIGMSRSWWTKGVQLGNRRMLFRKQLLEFLNTKEVEDIRLSREYLLEVDYG
jgi:hypothetical protein